MINGLLFVNGIMGVTEYFHKQGGLELFGVLAHQGSSGFEFGYGFWGEVIRGVIRAH